MSDDKTPSISINPNDFDPVDFGRILVTRMLTDTTESWAEVGDIAFFKQKGDLAFHLACLCVQMATDIALREGITPLEWWQSVLAANVPEQ